MHFNTNIFREQCKKNILVFKEQAKYISWVQSKKGLSAPLLIYT